MAAARQGLELLGMTDHAPSMPGAPQLYHFGNLSILPEELSHFWDRIGDFSHVLRLVHEAGILESQVLNTSPERVLNYLALRRQNRPSIF